jgi:hypothetical protein
MEKPIEIFLLKQAEYFVDVGSRKKTLIVCSHGLVKTTNETPKFEIEKENHKGARRKSPGRTKRYLLIITLLCDFVCTLATSWLRT